MTRSEAMKLRAAMLTAATSLDDATASTAPEMFPRLSEDCALISAGTRINWNGTVKRASADLWDTAENNPDNAPNLWENIGYRDGYRIIPEVITAAGAFAMDECGWWGDTLMRSKLAANVYTPEQYPDGWESVQAH